MDPIRNVTPEMLDPAVKPITHSAWETMTDEQREATWFCGSDGTLYPPNTASAATTWTGSEYLTDPRKPEFRKAAPIAPVTLPPVSPRDAVLHGALKAVSTRDNEAAYGTGNSFDAAAKIKAAIMAACPTPVPGPVEIAVTQIAVKLARLAGSGFKHQDSAVDLCGYAAWLHELATREEPKP